MILQDNIYFLTRPIFDIRPPLDSCDLQTYGVPPLTNEFCLLRVDWQYRTGLINFLNN